MVLVHLVLLLAEVADPAAGPAVLPAGPAVAAGLLHPVAVVELDWLVVAVAAGVAADLLSLLPA